MGFLPLPPSEPAKPGYSVVREATSEDIRIQVDGAEYDWSLTQEEISRLGEKEAVGELAISMKSAGVPWDVMTEIMADVGTARKSANYQKVVQRGGGKSSVSISTSGGARVSNVSCDGDVSVTTSDNGSISIKGTPARGRKRTTRMGEYRRRRSEQIQKRLRRNRVERLRRPWYLTLWYKFLIWFLGTWKKRWHRCPKCGVPSPAWMFKHINHEYGSSYKYERLECNHHPRHYFEELTRRKQQREAELDEIARKNEYAYLRRQAAKDAPKPRDPALKKLLQESDIDKLNDFLYKR